ncbi:hypothetical protein D0414_00340 [Staphylococcus epidermidis]|nr:hypothetical protein [Staphylococcus epidermidis]MBM0824498.1 hypothetical protein [Staphylococcus epidermidis]
MPQAFLLQRQTTIKFKNILLSSYFNNCLNPEFQTEILQTRQVGVRGPNIENFKQKFYRQSKLGFGVCLDNALITYAPLKPFIKIQSVNKINVYSFIYITHLSL